jgi:hypothetical protein
MPSPSDVSWRASRISASAELSTPVVVEEEEEIDEESQSEASDAVELAQGFRQTHENICPYVTIKGKTTIFFFTFRVLYSWDKYRASVQFVNNFLTLASTITALVIPENDANTIIGSLSLLLAQIILHSWYGFSRYPPLDCTQLLNPESSNGELEPYRDQASLILHGKEVHNDQKWQTLVSLPFTLPNVLATVVAEKVLWALGNCCCEDSIDEYTLRRYVVYLAMFVASLFWPFVFFFTDKAVWKVLASFAIMANEELYNSYLFRKDYKKFLWSFVLAFLGDFAPLEDIIEMPEAYVPGISYIPSFFPDEPTDFTDESGQVEREHVSKQDIDEALDFKGELEEELEEFKEDHVDDDPEKDKEKDKERTATFSISDTTQIGTTNALAAPALNEAVLDFNGSSSESDSSSESESD